jgi:hypothetical protein
MILFMASLKLCHRWLKKLYFTLSRRASARGGFLFGQRISLPLMEAPAADAAQW